MRERCVIFIDNDTAKLCGRQDTTVLSEPEFAYVTLTHGMYPVTPMDIRDNYFKLPVADGQAIVELFVERDSFGMISTFSKRDIVSVNLNMGDDLLVPHKMFWPSCMFRKDTHIFTDTLGWDRPMHGLTLLRNKQCMTAEAYAKMLHKLANGQGADIEMYIEEIMLLTYLDSDIIDKYKL